MVIKKSIFDKLIYDSKFLSTIRPQINGRPSPANDSEFHISKNVVWRITRITAIEDDEHVHKLVFALSTTLSETIPTTICAYIMKPRLYMWQRCFCNNIPNSVCFRNCIKMKYLMAPGVKGYENTINVYKVYRKQTRVLDDFLTTPMRLCHQYGITEGCYVTFRHDMYIKKIPVLCQLNDFIIVKENVQEIKTSVLAFDIEVRSPSGRFCNAKKIDDEIISISLVMKRVDDVTLRFCLIYRQNAVFSTLQNYDTNGTLVILHDSEKEMIETFLNCIELMNPDFITGYNSSNFDIPYIRDRMKILSMGNLFVRRFGFQLEVKFGNFFQRYRKVPAINIPLYAYHDTILSVNNLKLDNYSLDTVARFLLNENKIDLPFSELNQLWECGEIDNIIKYNVYDSELTLNIFLKLDVTNVSYSMCEIMKISTESLNEGIMKKLTGLVFDYAINNVSVINNETIPDPYFLLITDFYVCKTKQDTKVVENTMSFNKLKRQPVPYKVIEKYHPIKLCSADGKFVYTGGDVMQPRKGVFENVGIFDFEGMYATRMIKDKICETNIVITENGDVYRLTHQIGVVDKIVADLKQRRTDLKKILKTLKSNTFEYKMLHIFQNTVKEITNSMYGWHATNCKILAAEITRLARNKLYDAQNKINNHISNNYTVIYGDTDSCFVHVKNIDNPVYHLKLLEKELNDSWNGDAVIELENFCVKIILYQKKNYCFLTDKGVFKDTIVTKRRNKPLMARQSLEIFLKHFLQTSSFEESMFKFIDYIKKITEVLDVKLYTSSVQYSEGKNSHASYCVDLLKKHANQTIPHDGERIDILYIKNNSTVIKEKCLPLEMFDASKYDIDFTKFCEDHIKPFMVMFGTLLNDKQKFIVENYEKIFQLITKSRTRCYMVKGTKFDIKYTDNKSIIQYFH
uniref:DNA polymerase n=1 Tax=Nesodiprion zhejiangensis nucleopolyhedrovirus TaxID=3135970 RepID=A0AAN0N611_9BACU